MIIEQKCITCSHCLNWEEPYFVECGIGKSLNCTNGSFTFWKPSYKAMAEALDGYNFIKPEEMKI